MNKNKAIKIIISTIISVLILYFLLAKIDFYDLLSSLKKISLSTIIIGFIIYFFVLFLRSLRFKLFFGNKLSVKQIFYITLLHNFFINVLPFRSGELSYVYLLKKKDIAVSESINSLLIVRLFDTLIIIILLLISSIFIKDINYITSKLTPLLIIILTILIISIIIIVYLNKQIIIFLNKIKTNNIKFQKLLSKIKIIINNINLIFNFKIISRLLLYSIFIWILNYYNIYFLLNNIGINLSIIKIFFINSILLLSSTIPWSLMGFGIFEGTLTTGLSLFNINIEQAINSSFILHFVIIFYCVISALFIFTAGLKHFYKRQDISK